MIAISLSVTNIKRLVSIFQIFLSLFFNLFLLILWKPCYHYILFSQIKIGWGVTSSLFASHLCTWVHFICIRVRREQWSYCSTANGKRQTANVVRLLVHSFTHSTTPPPRPSKTPKSPTRGKHSAPPPRKKNRFPNRATLCETVYSPFTTHT